MQEYRTRRRDVVLGVMMAIGVVAGWLALVCFALLGIKL